MPLSKTQVGRVGELLFSAVVIVTSGGALELFGPLTDDDHVDLGAGRRGGLPSLAIQIKTTPRVNPHGFAEAKAHYPSESAIRESPGFLYAFLLLADFAISTCWIFPSPAFNRLAYRAHPASGGIDLKVEAHPAGEDRFGPYLSPIPEIGSRLLEMSARLGRASFLAPAGAHLVRRVDPRGG